MEEFEQFRKNSGSGLLGMISSIQEKRKDDEFASAAAAAAQARDKAILEAAQDEVQGPVQPGSERVTNEARRRAIDNKFQADMEAAALNRWKDNPYAIMALNERKRRRDSQQRILGEVNDLYSSLSSNDPQTKLDAVKKMIGFGNQFLSGGRYEASLDKNGELVISTYDAKGKLVGQSPLTETMKQEGFKYYLNFRTLQENGDLTASEKIDKAIGDRQNNVRAKDQKDTELALEERKAIETARHNRRIEELYDDQNNIKKPTGLTFDQNEADPTKQWIVGSNGEIIGEKDLKTGQKSLFGYDPKEVKTNKDAAAKLGIGYGYQEFMTPNGPTAAYVFSVNGKFARTLQEAQQLLAESGNQPKAASPSKETPKQPTKAKTESPKNTGRPAVSGVAGGDISLNPKTEAIRREAGERRKAMRNVEEAISRMFTKKHDSQSPDTSR